MTVCIYYSSMATTKVFLSGHSQAVRIPKAFRIKSKEVEILRQGKDLLLREKPKNLAEAIMALPPVSPDFFKDGREQPPMQRRRVGL
jgi:antitoxin VapB